MSGLEASTLILSGLLMGSVFTLIIFGLLILMKDTKLEAFMEMLWSKIVYVVEKVIYRKKMK